MERGQIGLDLNQAAIVAQSTSIHLHSFTKIVPKTRETALQISITSYEMRSPSPYINVGMTLCTGIEC